MKTLKMTAFLLLAALSLNAQQFEINPQTSSVHWLGKKVTGQHEGFVGLQSGTLNLTEKSVTGSFILDMNAISCTDIEDATYNANLVGHLKSDDFFSVETHPTATLNITGGDKDDEGVYQLSGDLTIKGITNPVSFSAIVSKEGNDLTANADFTIDRTKWDIRYGSGSFFDNLGDKVIYDDIEFKVELATAEAPGFTGSIDTGNSSIKWTGKKVTGQHDGTLALKSGSLDGGTGSFSIDMTSMVCTDIEDKETAGQLVGHLMSDDFFSVEKYPEAHFNITALQTEGDKHVVTGNLTIKGITNGISFPATFEATKNGFTATADVTINRTDWDIRYGSGSFFENLGDRMIYDDIELQLNLVFQK